MTFVLYRPIHKDGRMTYTPTGQTFKMAGNNLIKRAWSQLGCPIDKGWQASADYLIRILTDRRESFDTLRMFVDFQPTSRKRLGIIEILDIYAYTFGNTPTEPRWTPLMLRMRDIFYCENYDPELTDETKKDIMSSFDEPEESMESIEFLYMNANWSWGPNGTTNAAFINGEARNYFRRFF